jgi:hypothetical protein
MKTALLFVVLLVALVAAGCGSSSSSSSSTASSGTTSSSGPSNTATAPASHQASYLLQFQAVNNRFEQSPQIGDLSQALTAATGGSKTGGAKSLAAAEVPLQSYLQRLDTYIAELRGLHFPACARHFQAQIVQFESEGRASVAKILPLLRSGDVSRVVAYVRQASPILSEKLGQVEVEENALENGGNDGC